MPLVYKKRKEDHTFIKEGSCVKKEALERCDFSGMYGKGVKVSGVAKYTSKGLDRYLCPAESQKPV